VKHVVEKNIVVPKGKRKNETEKERKRERERERKRRRERKEGRKGSFGEYTISVVVFSLCW